MLVQCPKCKTTYKVPDESVKGNSPSFRCSRCKHTFELSAAPASAGKAVDTATNQTGENRELTFSFGRAEPESAGVESRTPANANQVSKAVTGASTHIDSRAIDDRTEPQTTHKDPPTSVTVKAETTETPAGEAPSSRVSHPDMEMNDNILAIEPYRDQPASVAPFLTLFGLLVIFFAFIWAYQKTNPAVSEAWVQSIPFLGPSVLRNDHLKNGVLLKSVETRYQSLQGNREVVVLTGVAVNQNPVMIRNVQLLGLLYDSDGKELERQAMWIGNAISSQIIRGMTAQDIADLQRLKPLKTFEIPPGDSVPFAIVFLRSAKQVRDARCEVLSAEGVAS